MAEEYGSEWPCCIEVREEEVKATDEGMIAAPVPVRLHLEGLFPRIRRAFKRPDQVLIHLSSILRQSEDPISRSSRCQLG
jgi:hypothetical protein